MGNRTSRDRRYTVVVIAFLVALVTAGLLGVPALLVAAGGALIAAGTIFALRGRLGAETSATRPATPRSRPTVRQADDAGVPRPLARQYVPSVLEAGGAHRRRLVQRGRRHRPGRPVGFR